MTANQSSKEKKKRSKSYLVTQLTRFIGFIFTVIEKSWIGRAIMHSGNTFRNSFIVKWILAKRQKAKGKINAKSSLAQVLERGFAARLLRKISSTMARMSINVYGLFFAMFGIFTVLSHFVSIYVSPNPNYDGSTGLVVGIIVSICSIPLLSSSKSVVQLFSGGKLAGKIAMGLLLIPEEKFRDAEKRGGVAYMLVSALLGIGCGVLAYFVNPFYILAAFASIISAILILSFPEIGVIISCLLMPLLQYVGKADALMFALICITALSYIIKLLRGKRTFSISASGVMVILFAITMLIAGTFSKGGADAFAKSAYNAFIILGAYFLGTNLTRNDNIRRVCVKILMVSLVLIAFLQFWNLYYINISEGVEQSLMTDYRSIVSNTELEVASNLQLPGLWAAMISPLLIAECFTKKRAYAVVALLLCFVPVVLSIAYFGTLEIMIALLVGVALYLVLHSPRSVANIIVVILGLSVVLLLLPIILSKLGIVDNLALGKLIEGVFPDSAESSSYRTHIVEDTWRMLSDGNLLGIGSGREAFKTAIAPYVTAVSKNADQPGTAFMQIFCEAGALGLAIFAIFSALLLKSGMKYVIKPTNRASKTLLLGLLCGYMTALLLGSVSCIFDEVEMRYMFWLCAGIISSQIFSDEAEERRAASGMRSTQSEIDVIAK